MGGSPTCLSCAAGTFAPTTASTTCQNCAPDTFSVTGASSCRSCPPPQSSIHDCRREVCDGGVSTAINDDTEIPLGDGIACTLDSCFDGGARYLPYDVLCDDGDPCTLDTCSATTDCSHTPIPNCDLDAGRPDASVDAGCTPANCLQQGLECGMQGDGCGSVIDCGTCTAPAVCGAGHCTVPDAGVDAGTVADAGTPDSGQPMADAGSDTDGGTGTGGAGGCGCTSVEFPAMAMAVLAMLRRRRNR